MEKVTERLEFEGRVLHLRLHAPPGNILDRTMMDAIERALDARGKDPRLLAIVFEGEGKHFSFGASVEEHTREVVGEMLPRFHGLFRKLFALAIPTFAVVRGQCLGGGLELAAACTWIFSTPDATFAQPEIRLGVFPPMASLLLPWRLGGARALDLCVSGRPIDGATAHTIGLVYSVGADPAAEVRAFIEKFLLDKSPSSLRFAERAARQELIHQMDTRLLELERLYLQDLMGTPDANEGIEAFLKRRPPVWHNTKGA